MKNMRYKNKQLELKCLKRQFIREITEHRPVMLLGFVMGIFIAFVILL